jgi:FAD/FMN-containing dehydrogenase
MTATSTATPRVPRAALTDLADRIAGRLLTPHDPGYRQAIDVFNAAIDHSPDYVVQATCTADVVTAVRFARDHGLDLSVKGGGHGVAGLATAGRYVIDLSRLRAVHVGHRAGAQAGCTWVDVDTATQAHGLATPGGRVTHTGIAGLTLGGGQGWLSPKHGLTCDNLLSAEVVTADGHVVTAGPGGEEDLLWALRGGGGNFGVVTRFDYRLHPVGPLVLAGVLVHPVALVDELIARYADLVDTAGPDLGGAVVLASAPDAPFVPPAATGAPVAVTTLAWFGDLDEGERVMAPLRAWGPPIVDSIAPMPYTALQALTDEPNPWGMRNYWSAGYVDSMSTDLVDALVAATETKRSPLSAVIVTQMGAAVNAVPEDATAFPHRGAHWLVHPVGMWADAADDDVETAWVRSTKARLAPFESGGGYLNDDSLQSDRQRVREVFGADKYARLAAIKARYDPDNVFHHAANIAPRRYSPANSKLRLTSTG